MSTINKSLLGVLFSGANLALAAAPWKNNVRVVYGFNGPGTGYTSFKPSNTFNSLSQLVANGVYILDVATPGFELPGASVVAVRDRPQVLNSSTLTLADFMVDDALQFINLRISTTALNDDVFYYLNVTHKTDTDAFEQVGLYGPFQFDVTNRVAFPIQFNSFYMFTALSTIGNSVVITVNV